MREEEKTEPGRPDLLASASMSEHEGAYRRVVEPAEPTTWLPGTSIEIVRPLVRRRPPRFALFDFDGTLSLIREGWPEVMVPLMVETLQATGTDESVETLERTARDAVARSTGMQTIYQMIWLADEVQRRRGVPADPLYYKQLYSDRLMRRIAHRREALRSGRTNPETMLVPGARDFLEMLHDRDVRLYLASGTDQSYVIEEAGLVGLDGFFGPHIYGALADRRAFSKAQVIERILAENQVEADVLVGFGDGYVEIQNVKEAGGLAVGVASDETHRDGRPDPWKRDRLIGVGADLIVPDFADARSLVGYLFGEKP